MAKSKHTPYHHQLQDQDHQNDQDQDRDQRPLLRRNTPPRIFGTSRQPEDEPPVLLDWNGLARKGIRFHPNHLRRLWMKGQFPKPIKISERRLAWREADVDRWISDKIAESA